jgi:hypothetical protein
MILMQSTLTITDFKERMAALGQRQQELFNQIPPFGIGDTGADARAAIHAEIVALQGQRP